MAVKIRLKRLGKIRVPQYRIVVVDSRKKRDGRVLEEIGKYHPKEEPSFIDVTSRASAVQRRVTEREAHERRMELVRRTMRMRGRSWSDAWASELDEIQFVTAP